MPKHIPRDVVTTEKRTVHLRPSDVYYLGIGEEDHRNSVAHVSLKYYDSGYECFSDWQKTELRAFSDFIKKLGQHTWQQIQESGGGAKQGFGFTVHKSRKKLPARQILDHISLDTMLFELRIGQKPRAHGFRVMSTFFLVWLDRNHKIYPM